jgi:2-oxo-4-hydroxy-4-carboxy-5-ureidoimidazoline decarboxylase
MTLEEFNRLSTDEAMKDLLRCCGSRRWAEPMAVRRPYGSADEMQAAAEETWARLDPADWIEAFTHHPKIGDVDSLRKKFAATANWASGEQAGVKAADEAVLQGLAQGNSDYEAKFGYIFIVCATGKTAAEMLTILRGRLQNAPDRELKVAAGEQAKITRIRIEKLFGAPTDGHR